ncbi:MAG: hypothetical protein ABI760_21520, partial [Ferruginibacter sp.]
MQFTTTFHPLNLKWADSRTYLYILLFVAGNLLLPQLCHLLPSGGRIFLPIYFFTLIASYKFGLKVGLFTALFSPLLNYLIFGMPPLFMLPIIIIKSFLLAAAASYIAFHFRRVSIFYLILVVVSYQFVGSLLEWAITQSFQKASGDITIGIPGMLLQVFGGWVILKLICILSITAPAGT